MRIGREEDGKGEGGECEGGGRRGRNVGRQEELS